MTWPGPPGLSDRNYQRVITKVVAGARDLKYIEADVLKALGRGAILSGAIEVAAT